MFTSPDELMDLCTKVWSSSIDPITLSELANSEYRLGDLGLDETEQLQDYGFIEELFQGHSAIYEVLGGSRQDFIEGFALLKVIAAAHPKTPHLALQRLSEDSDPEVLWAVAGNPSVTPEMHSRIIDTKACVSAVFQECPNPEIDESTANGIRYGVSDLWEISNIYVGVSAAGNRNAHIELIDWAVTLEHPEMNKALLLRNSDRLSIEHWERLLQTGLPHNPFDGGWIQWMAMSQNLPEVLYERILERPYEAPLLERRLAAQLNRKS